MSFGESAKRSDTPTFKLLSPSKIEALPDLEWLIQGVLPSASFGVLYGEPGCGKTFVALSMALSAANGQDWLDREVSQTKILYIAAEGGNGIKTRIQAFRKKHGLTDENVIFLPVPVEMMNPQHVNVLLKKLNQRDFKPGLIVVDTLARVALGADENNAKDMGQIVAGFDELKRQTGATVLVIHHTTKSGSSERGSSALRGAADVMIFCENSGEPGSMAVSLKCDKMKDDEPFEDIGATLEKVQLPGGKSSLVIGGKFDFLPAASAHADTIIEILEAKFAENGATHGELRKAFISSRAGSASKFDRAWKPLKETDRMRVEKVNGRNRYFAAEKTENNTASGEA
jgi:KaiC/GvpD/RAD55 family RecA-like ATPase